MSAATTLSPTPSATSQQTTHASPPPTETIQPTPAAQLTLPPSFPAAQPITVGPAAGTQWRVVAVDNGTSTKSEYWSPDGAHFLVLNFNQRPFGGLYDATGSVVRRYDHGTFGAWVDSAQFVLLDYTNAQGGEQANGWLASVDSPSLERVDVPFGDALPNGHGAIAFFSSGCDIGCDQWTYALWTPESGATERLPGEPLAWSPDGMLLFVLRPPSSDGSLPSGAPGRSLAQGWLEVVSWPDLRSVAQFRHLIVNDDVHTVDPSGVYMTFLQGDTVGALQVVDTRNGASISLPAASWSTAWQGPDIVIAPAPMDAVGLTDPTGNYLVVSSPRGTATVATVTADQVGTWDNVGRSVMSSPDGSTVVFWDNVFSDSRSFVTVITNGVRSELEALPSDGYIVGCGAFSLSLSDSAVLADCNFTPRGSDTTQRVILLHPV